MNPAQQIKKTAAGHGHGCMCSDCLAEYIGDSPYGFDKVLLWRLIAAAALFIAALATKAPWPVLSALLAVASILSAGYDVFVRAAGNCVRDRLPDEDLLMCVAIVVAVTIGRGIEGAFGMLLLQIGTLLRGYAEAKIRRVFLTSTEASFVRDSEKKSRAEEFILHFSRIYTPAILGLAVLLVVCMPLFFHTTLKEAIYKALVLMVIACPCAFVISIPLAYAAGAGGAARSGVLFRSDAAQEESCRIGSVAFDKQSVLQGEGLRVVSVKSDRMDAETLLRIAAHACAYAEDTFSESIKAAYQDTIYIELIQSFRQDPGEGITVAVDGVSIILGQDSFVREHGVDPGTDTLEEPCVYLGIDGQYAGRITFGAVARPDAGRAVQMLSWDNERQILLLSEENLPATEKFARSVGIGQYYADCGEDKKAAVLRDLRERKARRGNLAFVGSAETDSAALAEADLGVAMHASGAEAADILVPGDSPLSLVTAIETAKRTGTIVKQSILFALCCKLVILALDIFGLCPLWLAVFADSGVTLAVILNSLRALAEKETIPTVE